MKNGGLYILLKIKIAVGEFQVRIVENMWSEMAKIIPTWNEGSR